MSDDWNKRFGKPDAYSPPQFPDRHIDDPRYAGRLWNDYITLRAESEKQRLELADARSDQLVTEDENRRLRTALEFIAKSELPVPHILRAEAIEALNPPQGFDKHGNPIYEEDT